MSLKSVNFSGLEFRVSAALSAPSGVKFFVACCPFKVTALPAKRARLVEGAQLKGVRRPSVTPHAYPDPSLRLADPPGPGRSEPLRPDLPRTPPRRHDHGPGLRHRGPSRHHAAAKVAHLFQVARRGKVVLDCRRAAPLQDPRHPLRAAGLVSGHRRYAGAAGLEEGAGCRLPLRP